MGCKTIPEQLAEALAKETLLNSDTFPVVQDNTLYRATIGDLAVSLGLTGQITSLNDGNATPVLTGTAPDYKIRGILGGNGITANTNIYGNITISVNFRNAGSASDGLQVVKNTQADPIEFKRIKAGAGIEIESTANSITITNTQSALENNIVIVSSLDDLPTPISGVITLADNVLYEFVNSISTSNRFVLGANTIIQSSDPRATTLTYTGTGAMFTTNDGAQTIKEIGIDCPNGTFIDTTGNVSGSLLLRWILFVEVKNFGVLDKPFVGIYTSLCDLWTGNGFTYNNVANRRLLATNIIVREATGAGATFLDLGTATFNSFNLDSLEFLSTDAGQVFLSGAAAGANTAGDTIGYVAKLNVQGGMTGLDTISSDDPGWDFTDCNVISDTLPHALCSLDAPTDTVISAAGTPVQVTGTFTANQEQVYEVDADGTTRYIGKREKFALIDITMALEPVSGTNKSLTISLAKNGTVVAATTITRTSSAGSAAVVSIDWGFNLVANDEVAVFVGNATDTVDVKVNQLLIRVA